MKSITLKKIIVGAIMSSLLISGGISSVIANTVGSAHKTQGTSADKNTISSGKASVAKVASKVKKHHGKKNVTQNKTAVRMPRHSAPPTAAQALAAKQANSNAATNGNTLPATSNAAAVIQQVNGNAALYDQGTPGN